MSAKRNATIGALTEKCVADDDTPPGKWPGLHYAIKRVSLFMQR